MDSTKNCPERQTKQNQEKPYINLKELIELLGQGRRHGERVMNDLLKIAKEKNYYIPESNREKLIPTHLVKKELKIKDIRMEINYEKGNL